MSDKLSLLVLNPFSEKLVDFNVHGFKEYKFDYHGGVKHFMRELGVGKYLQTDEDKLQDLLKGGEKSEFVRKIKKCCNKNNVIHFILPLRYYEIYSDLLKNWKLKNKVFLHLVYGDVNHDLGLIEKIEALVSVNSNLVIGTLSHDNSVFNENNEWRELQKFYDEIAFFQIQTSMKASEYLKKCKEDGKNYIPPVSFINSQAIEDGDICIIGEVDQEKISAISKIFEVSKNENKRTEFNNFNLIFITKSLPNLELFIVKSPYSKYENHVFIEKELLSTLSERLSKQEIRVAEFGDKFHLKLLNKYFNNEKGLVYDGHKKMRCEDKYNTSGELAVSSNELVLKRFSDNIHDFEVFLLSVEISDSNFVEQYLDIINQEGMASIILLFPEGIVYSNLDFQKKNLDGEILNKIICEKFGI